MQPSIEEDCFDRLPDSLILLIFNKLSDAKSLIQCLSVCKRFSSLVSQTDTVFLSIPCHKTHNSSSKSSKPRLLLPINLLKILINNFIAKPLKFFHRFIACKSSSAEASNDVLCYSLNEVFKQFKEVKSVHLELPSHKEEIGLFNGDSLLKWKAEFDGELKSCVVLGATSFQRSKLLISDTLEAESAQVLCDDELKLRVIWTITCLMAASARHYLIKQMLSEHLATVESVTIKDAYKQGIVCMEKEGIFTLKESMKLNSATRESSLERTQLPDLSMKIWYSPVLELPESGFLMKGATVIVIRPVGKEEGIDCCDHNLFGFDGEDCEKKAFDEAVRELLKMKKSYAMTMNSF